MEKKLLDDQPFLVDDKGFWWGWCNLCKTAYVRCSECGNNCCNAGSGTAKTNWVCSDKCNAAYDHQHKYWKEKLAPKKEEFGDVPKSREEEILEKIFK